MSHSEFIHDELQRVTKEKEALEHELKQFQWIDVNERLPDVGQSVLALFELKGRVLSTYRMEHGNFPVQWQYDSRLSGKATHWMPLPKPPTKNYNRIEVDYVQYILWIQREKQGKIHNAQRVC